MYNRFSSTENATSASLSLRCWCVTSATPPLKPPIVHNGNHQQSITAVGLMSWPHAPPGYCSIITGHSPYSYVHSESSPQEGHHKMQ